MILNVYTDGSCKGNPGKGGYAFDVYDEFDEVCISGSGYEEESTNNRMELSAAIQAIRDIKKFYSNKKTIKIHADSSYLVNCINDGWLEKWKKNGWKTTKGESVLNQEYWMALDEAMCGLDVFFEKVLRSDLKIKEVDRKAKQARKI